MPAFLPTRLTSMGRADLRARVLHTRPDALARSLISPDRASPGTPAG